MDLTMIETLTNLAQSAGVVAVLVVIALAFYRGNVVPRQSAIREKEICDALASIADSYAKMASCYDRLVRYMESDDASDLLTISDPELKLK